MGTSVDSNFTPTAEDGGGGGYGASPTSAWEGGAPEGSMLGGARGQYAPGPPEGSMLGGPRGQYAPAAAGAPRAVAGRVGDLELNAAPTRMDFDDDHF